MIFLPLNPFLFQISFPLNLFPFGSPSLQIFFIKFLSFRLSFLRIFSLRTSFPSIFFTESLSFRLSFPSNLFSSNLLYRISSLSALPLQISFLWNLFPRESPSLRTALFHSVQLRRKPEVILKQLSAAHISLFLQAPYAKTRNKSMITGGKQ